MIHAKNQNLPKDKYHRTNENLLKTRELYPEIYTVIKDKDISIIYSQTPTGETERIKKGDFN